jgi:hypothetical protein
MLDLPVLAARSDPPCVPLAPISPVGPPGVSWVLVIIVWCPTAIVPPSLRSVVPASRYAP